MAKRQKAIRERKGQTSIPNAYAERVLSEEGVSEEAEWMVKAVEDLQVGDVRGRWGSVSPPIGVRARRSISCRMPSS